MGHFDWAVTPKKGLSDVLIWQIFAVNLGSSKGPIGNITPSHSVAISKVRTSTVWISTKWKHSTVTDRFVSPSNRRGVRMGAIDP